MKYFYYSILTIVLLVSPLFAQTGTTTPKKATDDGFPTADDMFSSITGAKGKDFSLADSIDDMISSMGAGTITENTEKTVKSAIEGKLVVEEVVPEVNKAAIEAIDKKTSMYAPRLQINFNEFPLKRHKMEGEPKYRDKWTKRLQERLGSKNIQVDYKDRVVRLSGTVATEHQREIAETMLRFEPNVDTIQNNLAVR